MKVKLKRQPDSELFKIPHKGKEGDLCYDVWAVSEEEVAPNVWKYRLGFAYEIERDYNEKLYFYKDDGEVIIPRNYNISIDFRPRSGVWKTGMSLCNCEGTLDEFYRGESSAFFYHVMPNMPRYKVGDRIGQIKLGIALPIEFEEVDEINMNTERGTGGFGSTGLK